MTVLLKNVKTEILDLKYGSVRNIAQIKCITEDSFYSYGIYNGCLEDIII